MLVRVIGHQILFGSNQDKGAKYLVMFGDGINRKPAPAQGEIKARNKIIVNILEGNLIFEVCKQFEGIFAGFAGAIRYICRLEFLGSKAVKIGISRDKEIIQTLQTNKLVLFVILQREVFPSMKLQSKCLIDLGRIG